MSNFFAKLIARSRGDAPAAAPRLPSRFEPMSLGSGLFGQDSMDMCEETVRTAPPRGPARADGPAEAPAGPRRGAAPSAAAIDVDEAQGAALGIEAAVDRPGLRGAPALDAADDGRAPPVTSGEDGPRGLEVDARLRRGRDDLRARGAPEGEETPEAAAPEREPAGPRAPVASSVSGAPPSTGASATPPSTGAERPTTATAGADDARSTSASRTPSRLEGDANQPTRSTPAVTIAARPAPPRERPRDDGSDRTPASERTEISVTIGRLEIRTQAAPARARARADERPTQSLDDYLRGREGGRS
ncbi:MAG: hypothetical protein R3B09_13155 [Nannocystaceae bacterium]